MKFRVFGGLDCPDSILAQLSVVSTLSPEQISKVVDHCANVIMSTADIATTTVAGNGRISNGGGDADAVATQRQQDQAADGAPSATAPQSSAAVPSRWADLTRETLLLQAALEGTLTPLEFAQAVTAIHTLVSNIGKRNVPADAATEDLSMLGLDPAVADVIVSGTYASFGPLRAALKKQMPMRNAVRAVNSSVVSRTGASFDEETNAFVVTEESEEREPLVRMQLQLDDGVNTAVPRGECIDMTVDKAKALLVELVVARTQLQRHNAMAVQH